MLRDESVSCMDGFVIQLYVMDMLTKVGTGGPLARPCGGTAVDRLAPALRQGKQLTVQL